MSKIANKSQIIIACPNTLFHLYVNSEEEISKIETFMRNIRSISTLHLTDVYQWCNRQGICYDTSFNFHRELPLWTNMKLYYNYFIQKLKYQEKWNTAIAA